MSIMSKLFKTAIETKPLTHTELLQLDQQIIDNFEKYHYIENNMFVMHTNQGVNRGVFYYGKHNIRQWRLSIEKQECQYVVTCFIDGVDGYVFTINFNTIENAKEWVKKLTALIQKLNNN